MSTLLLPAWPKPPLSPTLSARPTGRTHKPNPAADWFVLIASLDLSAEDHRGTLLIRGCSSALIVPAKGDENLRTPRAMQTSIFCPDLQGLQTRVFLWQIYYCSRLPGPLLEMHRFSATVFY
ncbi:uncharacterized protein VTP21DRAFT_2859 [Calcarisporiella thermophila]|uniref:uncharacterized protein n=1 Tax=Calcarisporiella thermophila TaxID=911321 RepID=UPI003743C346